MKSVSPTFDPVDVASFPPPFYPRPKNIQRSSVGLFTRPPTRKKNTPAPFTPRVRQVNPSGIQARHDQLSAYERNEAFDVNVVKPVIKAVTFLRNRCVMCWVHQRTEEWQLHPSDNCPYGVGTNKGDSGFSLFRSTAIRLPVGWCFFCLIHQVSLYFVLIIFYSALNTRNVWNIRILSPTVNACGEALL